MPRKRAGISEEQEYEEWLGRLDIPIEEETDIQTFRSYLIDELGITGDAQIAALWSVVPSVSSMAEHGIRQITIEYPWGVEVRYGIQGMPGLWGWNFVKGLREMEEW